MAQACLRWGVLGPGVIAQRFAKALSGVPGAKLQAVGSRDAARAREFAAAYGAEKAYGSYEELAADASVDAVYVATPHPLHREHALLCIGQGKHVLCEKPMSINAQSERMMADAARKEGVFLMEAMWTRFLPAVRRTRELISSGRIGEPAMLTADFSFSAEPDMASRLYNPSLGGGGLLDVGIYAMAFSSMVFGPRPEKATAYARIGSTGVDEHAAMLLQYPGGRISSLTCGVHACGSGEAQIMGTRGRITLSPFWRAQAVKITDNDGRVEEASFPFFGGGFEYEIAEASDCIRRGLLESPEMPLDESIAIMETMDDIRRSWGLKYPTEE